MTDAHPEPETLLYYETSSAETLLFAPRRLVDEIEHIHERLPTWSTWGEARRELSAERFEQLCDEYGDPGGVADDDPLEPDEIGAGEGWPTLTYGAMGSWLPDDVVERFGDAYSTMMDTGVNFPADREDEILAALAAAGIDCEEHHGLEELFGSD